MVGKVGNEPVGRLLNALANLKDRSFRDVRAGRLNVFRDKCYVTDSVYFQERVKEVCEVGMRPPVRHDLIDLRAELLGRGAFFLGRGHTVYMLVTPEGSATRPRCHQQRESRRPNETRTTLRAGQCGLMQPKTAALACGTGKMEPVDSRPLLALEPPRLDHTEGDRSRRLLCGTSLPQPFPTPPRHDCVARHGRARREQSQGIARTFPLLV